MKNKTFIPNWYEDKKNGIINKKYKICIIISLVLNIILMSLILNISKKTNNADGLVTSGNSKSNIINTSVKDIVTIEKYKELCIFFEDNNLKYKSIIINKENLEIDMEVKSYDEYIQVIGSIENHYSIKKLTPSNKNEEKYNFKVIIGV